MEMYPQLYILFSVDGSTNGRNEIILRRDYKRISVFNECQITYKVITVSHYVCSESDVE